MLILTHCNHFSFRLFALLMFVSFSVSCESDNKLVDDLHSSSISSERFRTSRKYRLSSFGISPFSSSAQGMDVYEDKFMFQAGLAGNIVYVLEIESHTCVGTLFFETPSGESSHMNNINCGTKYESGDRFPLLYISQTFNSHSCFVLRLSNTASSYEVVQSIKYVGENHYNNSSYDWFIDTKNNFIYTYGTRNGVLEEREIVKFSLPSLSQREIVFTDSDVIDWFVLDNMSIFQGSKIINGLLYAPVGYGTKEYPGFLNLISLEEKRLVMSIPLNCGEPESIGSFKRGALICGGGQDPVFHYIQL